MRPKDILDLLTATFKDWKEDKAPRLGAALAYYTVFSLAPLLIIAIGIAGLAFDRQLVQGQIVGQFRGLLGPSGGDLIETMIASGQVSGENLATAALGLAVLLLGALGVFGQLREALNTIWEVPPRPVGGLIGQIKSRPASLTMVLGVGFLVLVSLILTAALGAIGAWIGGWLTDVVALLGVVNFLVSFIVITVLFALMFRFIPDAKVAWGDVWIGAAITSLLFTVGKEIIGLYLGRASVGATFGPAGSLVLLLLWSTTRRRSSSSVPNSPRSTPIASGPALWPGRPDRIGMVRAQRDRARKARSPLVRRRGIARKLTRRVATPNWGKLDSETRRPTRKEQRYIHDQSEGRSREGDLPVLGGIAAGHRHALSST
jgi:membrane protein